MKMVSQFLLNGKRSPKNSKRFKYVQHEVYTFNNVNFGKHRLSKKQALKKKNYLGYLLNG